MTVREEYHRLMALVREVALCEAPQAAEIRTEAIVLMGAAALMVMVNREATIEDAEKLAVKMMDAALNGDLHGEATADVRV